ncbi:hypothetical protein, partial [Photobacterium damselae]|uniref:hypothetical protein n=1 Tax=Photobacterium damselae TaxID=38293 RepID=UPI002F416B8A
MNRYYQQGMSTLLITSMLLVVALIFSLASYKNLFYQIKRTQNEVLARQAHWAEEGGLECGFAAIQDAGSISGASSTFNDCESLLNLSKLEIDSNNIITSNDKIFIEKEIRKKVKVQRRSSTGAIKSSSDMYINGSTLFETVDPGELTSDGWECVAIRYKNIFHARSGGTNYGVKITKPYNDFNHNQKDCKESNKTNIASSSPFLNDFIHDGNLEPFQDLFNVPRSDWNKVKNDLNFYVIDDIGTDGNYNLVDGNKVISDCGKKIANEIESNSNRRLWVDGSCEIKDTEIAELNTAISNNSAPVLILVHDGIFAINTGGTGVSINGMLYHLNTSF